MGKLSASILAADFSRLGEEVRRIEPWADVIHIDVMDGHFVPPIALGAVIVRSLRPVTERTLHGHLMVDAPAAQFDELAEAGLDMVSFHLEAVPEPGPVIDKARGAGLGVGLTINLETPVDAVVPHLERIDDVMLMSIRPGWSYQQLDPEVYGRIERMRSHVDRLGLEVDVEIDGGIKVDNAERAVEAGATVLIAASGIFAQPDPAEAARRLRAIATGEVA
jgi:ribulose-phosphate 3-epimerase